MKKKLNLLIVEDSKSEIKSYLDNVKLFNEQEEIEIIPHVKENKEDGFAALSNSFYDAAIVDLKLQPSGLVFNGNQIIKEIKDKLRFPVFVITSNPGEIDSELKEENIFYRVFPRGAIPFIDILGEIKKIFNTGITNILGRKGTIEDYLHSIFWGHLSNSLDPWLTNNDENSLLRYVLSHLKEYLELDEKGMFQNYNPEEVYIKPIIKQFPYTGHIIKCKADSNYYIILSPPCDLAQKKTKDILIAFIEKLDIDEVSREIKKYSTEYPKDPKPEQFEHVYKQKADAKSKLNDLISNRGHKYHYLPVTNLFRGGFINFQKLTSISAKDIIDFYEPEVSITDNFCKDIINRFSFYYSRQGQPDMDKGLLFSNLIDSFN